MYIEITDKYRPGTSYTDVRTGPDQVLGENDVVWKDNGAWVKDMAGLDQVSGPSLNTLTRPCIKF